MTTTNRTTVQGPALQCLSCSGELRDFAGDPIDPPPPRHTVAPERFAKWGGFRAWWNQAVQCADPCFVGRPRRKVAP